MDRFPFLFAFAMGCGGHHRETGGRPAADSGEGGGAGPSDTAEPAPPTQAGVNFVRFWWNAGEPGASAYEPDNLFALIDDLGVVRIRQLHWGDPRWDLVQPSEGAAFDWTYPDSVLLARRADTVVRLFGLYWQSCTPPWGPEFVGTLEEPCETYVRETVRRYRDEVRYWELGNEMERWSYYDDGGTPPSYVTPPTYPPPDGFSPQQQGAWLAEVAAVVREEDPDAVILLPGLSGLDSWSQEWLSGVIEGGGTDWFDIVNYHYYGPWQDFPAARADFGRFLESIGIDDKPVWNTETGVSSDATLTIRTDYPNSQEQQAADVFRRPLPAWAEGEEYVGWHTLVGGTPGNAEDAWRGYGLRYDTEGFPPQPSWYSMKLLVDELLPFDRVEAVEDSGSGVFHYVVTRSDGAIRHVFWGEGSVEAPEGVTEMTAVVPDEDGGFTWSDAPDRIDLSDVPVLLR